MTELRASDLRFSSSEAAEFLNQSMGLGLSAEDIKILDTRTEGWIVGLQLAAISIQGRKDAAGLIKSFAGSHRFVLDYLIEEVLEQQSESVQTFLLQTAVLDRLNSSLCDLVTGRDNSQRMLEKLEHANLFILPMDEERRWYRYHQLFADLLRHRLKQKYPEKFPILHSRASMWYEQNGFIDEAIEHALRAEEFERTASLVEEHVNAVWESGEHIKLRRWLACLPDETVFCKPHLCIIRAWDLFTSGKHTAAERSLQAAEQAIDAKADRRNENSSIEQDRAYSSDEMNVHGRIAAIRAYLSLYRGDVAGTIHFACLALEHLPEQDSNWRITANIALGDAYSIRGEMTAAYRARKSALEASKSGGNLYMIASLKLADTSRQQGQLRRCAEICEQQLEFAQENGMSQTLVAGWLSAIWGETLAELNEPDRALQHASNGVKLTERGEDVMVIGWSNLCLLRVLFSRGDMAGAERIIQKMENIARKHDVPRFISNQVTAWQVRILLAQNQLTAAYRCLQDSGLDIDAVGTRFREVGYIALARTLIADGRSDESAVLLQRLFEETETSEHTSRLIEILMLQTLTWQARDDTDQAMTALGRALDIAEPGGYIRIFVDEGPQLARLLYEALVRGISTDYVRRLLTAFPVPETKKISSSQTYASNLELIEPLSEREIEVLQLIAEGLPNQDIGSRLFVSLNTVKVHTRNIYGKLGIHNRTQAVAKARALGILPLL